MSSIKNKINAANNFLFLFFSRKKEKKGIRSDASELAEQTRQKSSCLEEIDNIRPMIF
jgi:hypothetical protein